MNFDEFNNIVELLKIKKPILFDLDSDAAPTDEDINRIEKYYELEFPISYKMFLKKYGGGYFAYGLIYSIDRKSSCCIESNVAKDLILNENILPVYDFETGDLACFRINNKRVEDSIVIYNHEDNILEELNLDFYEFLTRYALKFSNN